jgi:hypothetical protein
MRVCRPMATGRRSNIVRYTLGQDEAIYVTKVYNISRRDVLARWLASVQTRRGKKVNKEENRKNHIKSKKNKNKNKVNSPGSCAHEAR